MALVSFAFLISQLSLSSASVSPLVLHFFDVGYGDAILIQLPEGGAILIDSGKPEVAPALVEKIKALGIKRLDSIFISHFHKDHAGGLLPIFEAFFSERSEGDSVGQDDLPRIVVPFIPDEVEKEVEAVLVEIKRRGSRIARRGDVFQYSPALRIEVLHPEGRIGNQNEDSMALRIVHDRVAILLGADIGVKAQAELLAQEAKNLQADLIKIPHHANEAFDAVFERFVQAVQPKMAILTIGPNAYGAPNPEMIAMYERQVNQIFRTDREGTITVKSDGLSLHVDTQRP